MSYSIDNVRLSASGLEKLSCPRRWAYYYLEGREDGTSPAAMLGSFAHETLEKFYALEPLERTQEALRAFATEGWEAFSKEYRDNFKDGEELTESEVLEIKSQVWNGLKNLFEMEDPPEVQVHSVEMKVEASFDGIPYIGFVDRIDYSPGGLVIKDYKAGNLPRVKFMSGKLMQLMLYGWALDQMGVETQRAELYYIKGQMIVATEINQESSDTVKAYLDESVTSIQNFLEQDEFPPVTSPLCGWCPYVTDCKEGEDFVLELRRFGRMRLDAPALTALSERDQDKPGSAHFMAELFQEV